MTFAIAFWVIMLVWLVFTLASLPYSNWVTFVLFGLLGWKVFGAPLTG